MVSDVRALCWERDAKVGLALKSCVTAGLAAFAFRFTSLCLPDCPLDLKRNELCLGMCFTASLGFLQD